MIIEFSVANYRSIDQEQSLSFVASPDKAHESHQCISADGTCTLRLLKSAVVFGPNASGKSNLLSALETLRDLVVQGSMGSAGRDASPYSPFHSSRGDGSPTSLKVDLMLVQTRYRYHLAYDEQRIIKEELYAYVRSKPQRWFSRQFDADKQAEVWAPFSAGLHGPREAWRRATGPRALFLSTAAQLNAHQLMPVLRWFQERLNISLRSGSYDLSGIAVHLRNLRFKEQTLKVLRAADFAVVDIRANESIPSASSKASVTIELKCERMGMAPIWMQAHEYSSGAERLIRLLMPLLDGRENDRFVVIDEFDAHLHPLVAKLLMRIVGQSSSAPRRIQILAVCLTTALLDLDVLRRDELWLMQMDRRNASRLRSLKSFSPRRREGIARAYLDGRYGALPRVSVPSAL